MTRAEWIVCERSSRWAAALRVALSSQDTVPRICETRRLSEIDAELDSHPQAITAIEVRQDHFAELLTWLTVARRRNPHLPCAALLDRSVLDDCEAVVGVLLEAGVSACTFSPRRLDPVIGLGERCLQFVKKTPHDGSFVDQVWASLPWQDPSSPVG